MAECIFCKIVEGSLDSYKVFENEHALAFLDIMPAAEGHVLVIPKEHAETLSDMSETAVKETMAAVQKVAKAVVEAVGVKGYNILQSNREVAGQAVFHVHFHIIPRKEGDGLSFKWKNVTLSPEQGKHLQGQIKKELE